MSERVTFEVQDAVGVISLARPDKLNALDLATFDGLHAVAKQARAAIGDHLVRAVLVCGEGRSFCSGLDVSLFSGQVLEPPTDDWIAHLQQAFTGIEDLPVPVVGAIHGHALGGGLQLALACHLRVVGPSTRLGLLEARWGLIPDLGGLTRLPRIVGSSRAVDLAVTARTIDGETAFAWGLADRLVDDSDVGAHATELAQSLAQGPTVALGAVPGLVRSSFVTGRDAMLAAERAQQQACLTSEDFQEAAAAALEGRPPAFRGQ